MLSKTRVAVLRGGPSSEYYVSLQTGATVLAHLPEKYHGLDVFIDTEGVWHLQGKAQSPEKIIGKVDAVWNALHGEYGEDGAVQYFLEAHAIPFTGSRRLPVALSQNKSLAKGIIERFGIKTPHYRVIRREETASLDILAAELYRAFPQPSIIKPVGKGSSIGVSVAKTRGELLLGLTAAFSISDEVLIEEYIEGREAVCGIIEGFRGDALYPLLPVEVELPNGSRFLGETGRYGGGVRYHSPGRFRGDEKVELQKLAQKIHELLGLRHYSRSEFIVHPRRGIFFLEVDALPDLLEGISPYVTSLHSVGATTEDFLDHVLTLALERR